MSIFVFPSKSRPLFYFTADEEVIIFFINNFLYSGNVIFQFLINALKISFPDYFICQLLRIIARKEDQLPHALTEAIDNITEFIRKDKDIFKLNPDNSEEIKYVIRTSHWQRNHDKFAIILFGNHSKTPFAVAKAMSSKHKNSIELEFNNTRSVHNIFSQSPYILIPEPIALFSSGGTTVYFERYVNGISFNNLLKQIRGNREKMMLYNEVLKRCKAFLVDLNSQKQLLTTQDFSKYFYGPIEYFLETDQGLRHSYNLLKLKEEINHIENSKMLSVLMHGDLWLGSILYNNDKIGIIDWELFSARGVPLWDFFSLVFHIGTEFNYFTDHAISEIADSCILKLAEHSGIDKELIPLLFQAYLIFNIQHRDTTAEAYWHDLLEYYWNISDAKRGNSGTLL
jgi:hypothetical protein